MTGDGRPTDHELRRMSREQLNELGDAADSVHTVSAEQPVPPDDRRRVRRAEAYVAIWFALAVLSAAAFCGVFGAWPRQFVPPGEPGHALYLLYTPLLGITFGGAVIFLGIGMTLYLKRFLPDEVAVMEREDGPSEVFDRKTAAARLHEAGAETQLAQRGLARRLLLAGLAACGAIAGVLAIGTFVRNPLKGGNDAALWMTGWKSLQGETVYLRMPTGVTGEIVQLRPEDLAPGAMATVVPFRESDRGDEKLLVAADHSTDSPVMLVRFRPDMPVKAARGQERYNWGDYHAFSRICTHLGCPAALYNELTGVSLCPCHQSAFDLTDGAKVVFGPAVRPLPQLPITVNAEGYFVATGDFSGPVGPGFWEVRAPSAGR
jgi:quinol---cytochrome c reductase iron-sulfur subunit